MHRSDAPLAARCHVGAALVLADTHRDPFAATAGLPGDAAPLRAKRQTRAHSTDAAETSLVAVRASLPVARLASATICTVRRALERASGRPATAGGARFRASPPGVQHRHGHVRHPHRRPVVLPGRAAPSSGSSGRPARSRATGRRATSRAGVRRTRATPRRDRRRARAGHAAALPLGRGGALRRERGPRQRNTTSCARPLHRAKPRMAAPSILRPVSGGVSLARDARSTGQARDGMRCLAGLTPRTPAGSRRTSRTCRTRLRGSSSRGRRT